MCFGEDKMWEVKNQKTQQQTTLKTKLPEFSSHPKMHLCKPSKFDRLMP